MFAIKHMLNLPRGVIMKLPIVVNSGSCSYIFEIELEKPYTRNFWIAVAEYTGISADYLRHYPYTASFYTSGDEIKPVQVPNPLEKLEEGDYVDFKCADFFYRAIIMGKAQAALDCIASGGVNMAMKYVDPRYRKACSPLELAIYNSELPYMSQLGNPGTQNYAAIVHALFSVTESKMLDVLNNSITFENHRSTPLLAAIVLANRYPTSLAVLIALIEKIPEAILTKYLSHVLSAISIMKEQTKEEVVSAIERRRDFTHVRLLQIRSEVSLDLLAAAPVAERPTP